MAFFKLAFLCAVFVVVNACSSQLPGTTVTTVTTTTSTVSSSDSQEDSSISRGRRLILKTWEMAKRNGDISPKILFRFLKAHPEYQKNFKTFANVPMDELMGNGHFLAQAYTILAGLNVIIQTDGFELVYQEIQNLGAAHFSRGVNLAMFEEFAAIIVEVIEEELGSGFSPEAKKAWEIGFCGMNAALSKNLKNKDDLSHIITGLTPRQVLDVQRTWENLRLYRSSIVSAVFLSLFKDTPRLQKAFAKFANVAADALTGDDEFNKQVQLVADRLDNMISTMDNTLQIVGQVDYMAYSHIPRNVGRQQFEDFAHQLLEQLSSKGVAADDLDSWRGTLAILVDEIDSIQKNE